MGWYCCLFDGEAMKQARVNLTGAQLTQLTNGGVLTIRLRDTELLLTAKPESVNDMFEKLVDIMMGRRKP